MLRLLRHLRLLINEESQRRFNAKAWRILHIDPLHISFTSFGLLFILLFAIDNMISTMLLEDDDNGEYKVYTWVVIRAKEIKKCADG